MLAVNSWNEVYTYAFLHKGIFECFPGLRLKMNGSGWIDSESGWVCCPWLLQRLDRWRHFSIEHVSARYKVWHSAPFCISSFFVLLPKWLLLNFRCSGFAYKLLGSNFSAAQTCTLFHWRPTDSMIGAQLDLASVTCVNLFWLARKLLEPHV